MLFPILSIIAGLIILVWSADRFVIGAAVTAKNSGMSPMLIGLTIVAFGTSAPEILVSVMASISGSGSLAVGNALGSNIANMGLVLGITALIAPLPVKSAVLRKEMPLLLAITLLAGVVLINLDISLPDALLLLSSLVVCLILFAKFQKNGNPDDQLAEEADEIPEMTNSRAIFWLILGLSLLVASSRLLVWGAVEIATQLGISELVIGLTIVAIGTSLPELAASVASALKKHHDIALGNIVGSNIFNLAAVMAIPGLVDPITLDALAFNRDYLVMLGMTVALLIFCLRQRPARINRIEGGLLTAAYAGYMLVLYNMST
ncbi:calcium/sodium antiporter [Neptunomonas antarctica]|uniref:Cation:H+ antiporter n=1 Tax=Neptunomonas antarctica TaxID=619304 RepID=A0A1N7NXC5_9GAMM|nr:calcium/sodium antiporter [Neptunomonas antarctica]SIT02964.1 cation:H+ antiporter [Neptunomonas antarctica]